MALTGFKRSREKRSGGIRSVSLIEAANIDSVDYDPDTGQYRNISTVSGASFAKYEFREDGAAYGESIKVSGGSVAIGHELTFFLSRMDGVSQKAIAELIEASYSGFAALVTTNCGDTFLVGYSPEFGTERPMRIVKTLAATGRKLDDDTGQSITFYSEDTAPARRYSGAAHL